MLHLPDVPECDRIAALSNPVLRNLCITQCYAELSAGISARLQGMANWCSFATWASKQAGQTIREEDLDRALEQWLGEDPAVGEWLEKTAVNLQGKFEGNALRRLVWEALDTRAILQRSSDAVARGNQKVFAEIGRAFARFSHECMHDEAYDAASITRFCAEFRSGEPPEGQEYLQRAFGHYYRALFENDPVARAEWVLLANLEIGFHEQTRLQPEIAEALDAAMPNPTVFMHRMAEKVWAWPAWLIALFGWFLRLGGRGRWLDQSLPGLYDALRRRIRLFLTRRLMSLEFPGERLALGDDLRGVFPPHLRRLQNEALLDLLSRIDASPDSLRDTGTGDWVHLPDRLHFIADLFRCYHENPALFERPFSPEQVAAFKAGELPAGKL